MKACLNFSLSLLPYSQIEKLKDYTHIYDFMLYKMLWANILWQMAMAVVVAVYVLLLLQIHAP